MDISEDLLCLYTAQLSDEGGSYSVEVPARELEVGDLEPGGTYRVAVLPVDDTDESQTGGAAGGRSRGRSGGGDDAPPVDEGDVVDVEIEDIGEQGDGIARVGPGYVIIVSETARGERVAAEVTETRPNVAFADVVEYYDRSA